MINSLTRSLDASQKQCQDLLKSGITVSALIRPHGAYLILELIEGTLFREGGLLKTQDSKYQSPKISLCYCKHLTREGCRLEFSRVFPISTASYGPNFLAVDL